jgi:hypothetical protein
MGREIQEAEGGKEMSLAEVDLKSIEHHGTSLTDFISLGAGVQSTTLLLMACHGEIFPKPRYAIFADTGWEPKKVYKHLEWLKEESSKYGIEVIVTSNGNIRDDLRDAVIHGTRVASLPFFVKNKDGTVGMVNRQCTDEYKIKPVRAKIKDLLGVNKSSEIKEPVHLWRGITIDEIERVKPSNVKWIVHEHPLIDLKMSRADCIAWMKRKGYPEPPISSCIGCPFHSDRMWLDIKRNDPEAWKQAVDIDRLIKGLPAIDGKAFLHRSCKPLDEVYLQEDQLELNLFINECEGMCGV